MTFITYHITGLKDLELPGLDIEHRFSAEIVVWKQSFIENNFHPQIIFRDIREMAAGKQASVYQFLDKIVMLTSLELPHMVLS